MKQKLIYHNSRLDYYRTPFGAAPTGTGIRIRLAVQKSVGAVNAVLRVWQSDSEKLLPMERVTLSGEAGGTAGGAEIGAAGGTAGDIAAGCTAIGTAGDTAAGGEAGDTAGGAAAQSIVTVPGTDSAAEYDTYETVCDTGEKPCLLWYYFIVKDGGGTEFRYGNNPEMLGGEGFLYDDPPASWQVTVYDRDFHTPGWFRQSVIYQIFPDRFYQKRSRRMSQAEIVKKRPDYIYHENWNESPIYKPSPKTGEVMNNDFFGGNLAGIAAKLPYLKDLGISVIYLNPIFEAYSNHRYDTGNYRKIDALLGTNRDFSSLCEQAQKFGIRLILDGVFNHTGSDSLYFNRERFYPRIGAYQSSRSKYYKWYMFKNHPDEYESWWGFKTLPNVNESEPEFIDYILEGEDSVVKHWLRLGASGWRLDVVDELPGRFVKTLRKNVKKADPDAVIIGEVWEDASNKVSYGELREYLLGDELDSVMNYVFKNTLISFVTGHTDARRFDAEIAHVSENYPKECYYSLMNLVGGHDVPRVLTVLSDPPTDLSKDQKAIHRPTTRKKKLGVRRQKLVSLIQMTFPGVPCVYYGDEAGMTGFEDPFNRGTFPWDDIDAELHSWYRRVIALRNSCAALRTGGFETVCADGAVYVYAREINDGRDVFGEPAENGLVLIAVNRDTDSRCDVTIDLGARGWKSKKFFDVFAGHIVDGKSRKHTSSAASPSDSEYGGNKEGRAYELNFGYDPADRPIAPMAHARQTHGGILTLGIDPLGCCILSTL